MKKKQKVKPETNSSEKKNLDLRIPILSGSYFDLTLFDFSFKNISIYNIQSEEFEKYIEGLQPDNIEFNLDFIEDLRKEIHFKYDKKFAIVKNNPRQDYDYQDIINVWKLLLIIHPSDLQIQHIIHYYEENGFIQSSHMTSYDKRVTGEYPGKLLLALEEDVEEINEFVKLYFDRLNHENYIGIAIENYLTSFDASHLHYQYLTLCIALESIIHGRNELTYRLRRTVSVLCGKDVTNCNIIYDNLNKLYTLRSEIIHGEEYSMVKVHEYMQPLQSIVSRAIIELLIHNVPKNKDLNATVTRLAFGDRGKITDRWKYYKLNISTIVDSNWKTLT